MKTMISRTAAVVAAMCATCAWGYPGEDRVISSKALKAYKAGDFPQAQDLYSKAAEKAGANAPEATFNAAASAYKGGKTDEAEKSFRSVFDHEDRLLNAAAGYNLGVIEHSRADKALETARKAPSLAGMPPDQLDPLKKEIEAGIKSLETAMGEYRQAILRAPADRDMKENYEVAARDLDFLKKKLEEIEPPPQQSQDEQKQDQQQQDQQKQDQQQQKDQQQDQQDQQQKDQQKQEDQKQQDGQPKPPEQKPEESGEQDKDEGDQGEKKPDPQKDQPGEPKDEEGKGKPEDKPEDKPSDSKKDGEKKDGEKGKSDGKPGEGEGKPSDEPVPGEMSDRDVERLLNSLPSENMDALQRMLNVRTREADMEKDW